jgi:hypothetical protein
MIPLALVGVAVAGSVFINGVRADVLPEVTLTNATVRLDAQGNVWIEAPGFKVEVVQPAESAAPPPPPPPSRAAPLVQEGVWWLVTEDNASGGQALDVLVNGALVRRVLSGEPQLILDLAPWLRPGANTVVVSPAGGGQPTGGALNVYLGRGSVLSGTIHLNNPDIVYSRRAADASGARQYTLTVP